MITATFTITLDVKSLSMQLIYGGKTRKSIRTVKFPRVSLLSVNRKHYSNEEKTLKLLKEVLVPYRQNKRITICLDADYPALSLLIMDVF